MTNRVFKCLTTTSIESAIYVQDQWCSCLTLRVTYMQMVLVLQSLNLHLAFAAP